MLYNISPNMWGKYFWGVIHYITIAYPDNPTEEDKQTIQAFIQSLQNILPCEKCRSHFKSKTYPLTDSALSSRYEFIKWGVTVHNEVNRRTGKKEMTVDDAIALYTNPDGFIGKENNYDYNQIITIILLIALMILLIYYIKFY